MAPGDRAYLAQIVANKTGASPSDAEVAHSMYWTLLALLVGAFCASVAATVGGNQRDRMAAM